MKVFFNRNVVERDQRTTLSGRPRYAHCDSQQLKALQSLDSKVSARFD